jgi:CheY-like chemotaxis protein
VSNPRILVIDDVPANLLLMRGVLGTAGLDAEVAGSAATAQALIHSDRPDVILMDVDMPGTDGLTLTRRLKADPATEAIVVIAVSADEGHEETAVASGCAGFMRKPIDVRTFVTTMLEIVARAKSEGVRAGPPGPPPPASNARRAFQVRAEHASAPLRG